jgi:hypothetical protein
MFCLKLGVIAHRAAPRGCGASLRRTPAHPLSVGDMALATAKHVGPAPATTMDWQSKRVIREGPSGAPSGLSIRLISLMQMKAGASPRRATDFSRSCIVEVATVRA